MVESASDLVSEQSKALLLLLVGIPASGKSTLARNLQSYLASSKGDEYEV